MNPLAVAGALREDYLRLLRTTFAPRQAALAEAFGRELEREGFLTREPFVALAQPYRVGQPIGEILDDTRRRFGIIAERPFEHQRQASLRILDGLPTVVATGTGSGKTEAFLLPIVDHCLRHRGESGPKAVLIYPMNALVNDQRLRVRSLLAGTGVSYGAYTGETQFAGERPEGVPAEERVLRGEFAASPPDLMLTNYQMLEYLLIRGDGRAIFRDHRVRFVVLDEVHTYHGALGTDVAYLLRRLRAALRQGRPEDPDPLFIGTSATLHAGDTGDPRAEVAAFFEALTGQATPPEGVVTEQVDLPEPPPGLTMGAPPEVPGEMLRAFDPERPEDVLALASALTGRPVGDLEAVAMRNIPPRPANYAQRTGRTGRWSRMGIAVGFSRNTPHDGYFFDHPDEMITGAIGAPRFNTANPEALARHLRSLVLEEARVEFPANLAPYLTDEGVINDANVEPLIRQVQGAQARAAERALQVFAGVAGVDRPWVEGITASVGAELRAALERRGRLIAMAVGRMRDLGQRVTQTFRDQEAERGFRQMANRLRLDFRYAYLPRALAEDGLLPGYAFPGDPGSLALGFDAEPIFANRVQAQREYCPGQIVYARGRRWAVRGLALHRPGSLGRTRGEERFAFTVCPNCSLANPHGAANNCLRCNALLDEGTQTAVDAGAFQAWPDDVEPESEEERALVFFDVRAHPQRDVPGLAHGLGPWRLEFRRQESIWWINHGPLERSLDPGPSVRATGFRLCLTCGDHLPPPPTPEKTGPGGRHRRKAPTAPQAERDPHAERCSGEPLYLAIGHQARADTLRLLIPGLERLEDEGVAWAWSFAYAIVEGAARLFEIDEEDLEPLVLTRRLESDGPTREAVMEVVWIDRTLGGSGILEGMVARFPEVAAAAVRHLEGHDCARACYRCLMTYRNQRVHRLLDWRLVWHHLEAAAQETIQRRGEVRVSAHITEGPEWEEARREGCESPLELQFLRAIRAAGLPEPEKQYLVLDTRGIPLARTDFAYLDQSPGQGVLIFVDGLKFHGSMTRRLHDARQTQRLQEMGFTVLRFWGAQVARDVEQCVGTVRNLLSAKG